MNRFAAPSLAHWLGTDHLGRDLYSRLVHGATVAMSVALSAIAIALGLGTLLGIVAAYLPARLERFVLIVFDVISSFPSMVLALAIVAVFGPSTLIVVVIVGDHADAALRPRGAGAGAGAQERAVPRGRAHPRRVVPAHRRAPHPAQHHRAAGDPRLDGHPGRHHDRGRPVVPGPRRAPAARELGHADPGRLPVPVRQLGAGGRVERGARRRDARLHAVRRGAARRGRPAHPAGALSDASTGRRRWCRSGS